MINIAWIYLIVVVYIGISIYRNRQNIKKFDGKVVWESMKENSWKTYVFSFLMFVLIFTVFRGIAIGQTVAQECQVTVTQQGFVGGFGFTDDEMQRNAEIRSLEQGRSYNYYRRYFNSVGGRPSNVGIVCEWNMERFINNILLDYNEREVNNG